MKSKVFTLFTLFLIFSSQVIAQNIGFQLFRPPGEGLTVDESLRAMITNNSQEPLEIYLRGSVQEEEDGLIFEGESNVIELDEETSQNLSKRNVDILKPIKTNFPQQEYKDYLTRTSEFPPGSYRICVQVVRANNEQIIAEDCYEKTIQEFLPPSLISPGDGALVSETQPFFTWSPVPGTNGGNISYTLSIVEMMGNQTPVSAFESNPLWFKESGISTPLFQYPVSAREFSKKKGYAWKVSASKGSNDIGESEVWSFTYQTDTISADEEEEEEEKEEKDEEVLIPGQYASLSADFYSGYYLLDDYQLSFVYENKYATSSLKCHLQNKKNDIIARDILKSKQNSGLNFNELDMSNRVEPGETYLLHCNGPLGEDKGLRFKVQKENSENVIDDLNIDEDVIDFQNNIFNDGE